MKCALPVALLVSSLMGCTRQRPLPNQANQPSAHAPVQAHERAAAEAGPARFVAVISARHIANVSAQVEGTLKSVDVRLGDSVREGDVLATIDDKALRQAASAARAVADMRNAEVRAALARAQHSASELERGLKLQSSGLVSLQALEALKSSHSDAQAAVLQTQAASREGLALLSQAQRGLEWSIVRAPVAGTIALRFADPGNQVHLDQPLVRIVADDAPWIRFGMPARDRDRIAVGDRVTFVSVDGSRHAPAQVVHIAPDVDPLSELILGEASFSNALEEALYPGFGGYVVADAKAP